MRIGIIIFAIVLFSSNAFASEHPLKMSFSKLTIGSNGVAMIETRIFLDDLTAHMQEIYNLRDADFSAVTSNGTQALRSYLLNHFYFEQDGQKLNLLINAVSISKNQLALVVNLNTAQPLDTSKEITLINTLLSDAFPTQVNSVKYFDRHYNLSLSKPEIKLIPLSNQ